MRIVHIGPSKLPVLYRMGGATERRIRELAARQAGAGAEVVIYSAEQCGGRSEYQGAQVRAIRCRTRGPVRDIEFLVKALADARSVKPDVIHFHSQAEGSALARNLRAATVLSYDFFEFRHGKGNPLHPWYRRALTRFTRLLPVSEYCRRESAEYWSLPAERMEVVYNGVNLRQFRPDAEAGMARRRAAGLNGEFTLLYVGRVCLQKGTDLLVEATRRLREEGRAVRAAVAGPIGQFGTEGGNELTERLRQAGGVYLGPVTEDDLPSVYNLCDAFVMPTRVHEMFGMAAAEAQACGRPVICSDNGGLPEVIPPSSGLLFEAGSVDGLVRQVRTLMDCPALRERLGSAAPGNARRFSWETIAAQLERIYQGGMA